MKIALVDDEKLFNKEMERLCHVFAMQNNCPVDITFFSNGTSFLDGLQKGDFSIVFMDILMKGMNGVETARKMREIDNDCLLVFMTSSKDFMPDAFSCHAFDYIVKPFTMERVFQVLSDCMKKLPDEPKYIEIVSDQMTLPLYFDQIISVVSDLHYLKIGLLDGSTIRSRMTMKEFQQRISCDSPFILINRGILLNADHITHFDNNNCIVEGGASYPIRVRDRSQIEQKVHHHRNTSARTKPEASF